MENIKIMKKIFLFFSFFTFLFASEIRLLDTMEADFTQTIIAEDESQIKYQGKMYAKSPAFVLWKYQKPIIKEVYIQSSKVAIFEPKLEQVIFSDLKENLDIFFLIKQAKNIKENLYTAKVLNQNYSIVTKSDIIQKLSFVDALGNKVLVEFSNIKVNHPLSDEIFIFNPPENVDLIYQ